MVRYADDTTARDLRQRRFERACWWLDHGIEVVPLKPQSKELQPGYGSHKACIADVAFARKWFLNTNANLGVVLGGNAGLVVADWDSVQDYEVWRNTAGARVDTLAEQTARGYHLFFTGESLAAAVGDGCEFKTSGVCMVSPSVHPSGVIYHIVNNASITSVDGEKARSLFPFLSEAHGQKERDGLSMRTTPKRERDAPSCNGVVARIKATRPILDEMNATGVKLQPGGKSTLVGLCPFHDDHSPSLWVNPESGLWGCNQPRCPAAGIHDVINFRALKEGISNRAAIRRLADEFL
ncbi:MAG: bifunctional DNA primase/polymerase [Anaerolineaceae bacterium]|nr:bifunctional DNA primase/polymerase [Anaerolineaceae bacterium]